MNIRQSMQLSAIIDKIEIKINNPEATQSELGADLILQLISGAYKAEPQILKFIADIKKISIDEAADMDIIEFINVIKGEPGLKSFFTSAVK